MLHNSGVQDYVDNHIHNERTHTGSRNTPLELIRNYSSSRQATRKSNFKSTNEHCVSILSDKDPCGWPMRRFLFLFLLSISGIPKFVNIIKNNTKKLKNGPCQHKTGQKNNKTKNKIKNTKLKIKCVGGGGGSSLFALSDL